MLRLDDVLLYATTKHLGQRDLAGQPYIFHVVRVTLAVKTESQKIVALCHDVVEDTDETLEDIKRLGVTEEQLDAVDRITKKDKRIQTFRTILFYFNRLRVAALINF